MTSRIDLNEAGAEEQRLIALATARIFDAMDAEAISQAELARRIGKSEAHVSQVLDGNRNMTLRTLAVFGLACGVRWTFAQAPKVSYTCQSNLGAVCAERAASYGSGALAGAVVGLRLSMPVCLN